MRVDRPALLATAAAVVALATDAFYLALIASQGGPHDRGRVAFVAGTIALAGAFAGLGAVEAVAAVRLVLLTAAATALLLLGVLGIFSIGLLLLVAGLFAVLAAAAASAGAPSGALRASIAASIAVVVLIAFGMARTA